MVVLICDNIMSAGGIREIDRNSKLAALLYRHASGELNGVVARICCGAGNSCTGSKLASVRSIPGQVGIDLDLILEACCGSVVGHSCDLIVVRSGEHIRCTF